MLWLYDENRPEILFTADARTTLLALGVAAGIADPPAVEQEPAGQVVCFNAARLARLGAGGPDA